VKGDERGVGINMCDTGNEAGGQPRERRKQDTFTRCRHCARRASSGSSSTTGRAVPVRSSAVTGFPALP
jgi:hypothetical protein